MTLREHAESLVRETGAIHWDADQMEAFLKAVIAEERERCARICEETHKELDAEYSPGGCTDAALEAAERIRKRPIT